MLPTAGRVAHCLHNWVKITLDPWILEVVKGYHLDFTHPPFQPSPRHTIARSPTEQQLIEDEVSTLLQRQAVIKVDPSPDQFVSRIFLVPKRDGSFRPVINLRPLNAFIRKQHFKMEGTGMLRDLLQVSDWMCSIDLKDAYLSVSISQEHRRYLRFTWKKTMYEFTCLPFGLCSAPRVFTKLMKPMMAFLRGRGLRTIIYLDDLLIMNQSPVELQSHVNQTVSLLESLGFTINREKSQLVPSQQVRFLGFQVDSVTMKLFLPEDKIQQIVQMC